MKGLAIIRLKKLLSIENLTQKWYADNGFAVGKQSNLRTVIDNLNFLATLLKHPNASSKSQMKNSMKPRKFSKIQEAKSKQTPECLVLL